MWGKKEIVPGKSGELINVGPSTIAVQMSPIEIMQQAKAAGLEVADMKEMLALQKEYEANEARKSYHQAFAEFKSNPPEVLKDKKVRYQNKDGSWTEYWHTSLGSVATAVGESLGEHGLSASWKTEQLDGGRIRVTCTISHRLGHQESTTLEGSPDQSGGKNNIQAVASTITYLERYTLMAITGTASEDMDDDGRAGAKPIVEKVTSEEVAMLENLIKEVGANKDAFLRVCKIEALEDMPSGKLKNAILRLEEKR